MRIWLLLAVAAGCRGRFDQHVAMVDSYVSYRASVLGAAPVGYWRFGAAVPMDEVTGATALVSGGCTPGAAGAIVGDPDAAFAFDGTCRITLPDNYDFAGTHPFAIETWLSAQTDASFHLPVAREVRGAQDPIDGYALVVAPAGLELERVIGGINTKSGPVAFTMGVYVHVVVQYTGMSSQIFVDGALADDVADPRPANEVSASSLVGAANPGNYYTGLLDELSIYDRALSNDEISQHHAIGARE